MVMVKIEKVKFRKILNSAGKISLEVEMTDCDGRLLLPLHLLFNQEKERLHVLLLFIMII